jgi:hypothetical protein
LPFLFGERTSHAILRVIFLYQRNAFDRHIIILVDYVNVVKT